MRELNDELHSEAVNKTHVNAEIEDVRQIFVTDCAVGEPGVGFLVGGQGAGVFVTGTARVTSKRFVLPVPVFGVSAQPP